MSDDFNQAHKIETYKSMISISVEGIKLLALFNGGAAAGVLAAYDKIRVFINPAAISAAMGLFVLGLFSVGGAILLAYVTQLGLFNESMGRHERDSHIRSLRCALACCLTSLMAFGAGAMVLVMNAH